MSRWADSLAGALTYPVWEGALGKCWIANLILASAEQVADGMAIKVLDLGAGSGEGWISVVRVDSKIDVTLWDPGVKKTSRNPVMQKGPLQFVDSPANLTPASFDFVTSMSVAEHVRDLKEHLQVFSDFLADDGLGIVLWDDGHFRPEIDMSRPVASGTVAVKELAKWGLSVVFGRLIPPSLYQRRRSMREVVAAAEEVGLAVVGSTFINIRGIKPIVANLSEELKLKTLSSWLKFEQELLRTVGDDDFRSSCLNKVFTSRLILVQKKDFEGVVEVSKV